jgi:hypothetical protein
MSDVLDIRLLGEQVKRLQEDVRDPKLAVELQGQTLAARFQTGFQQVAAVIGKHLAVMDRRIDNLVNVIREQSDVLRLIEAKLAVKIRRISPKDYHWRS